MSAAPPRPPRVLLGVTGSIAAYKACDIVRLCVKRGWEVRVVLTEAAARFVTPLTFRTLSRNPVAEWADVLAIAPCTAHTAAALAHGLADNLLLATALATRAPRLLAPAMNTGMWDNPATQDNLRLLRSRGDTVLEPDSGDLACGATGRGRMPAPDAVVAAMEALLPKKGRKRP